MYRLSLLHKVKVGHIIIGILKSLEIPLFTKVLSKKNRGGYASCSEYHT